MAPADQRAHRREKHGIAPDLFGAARRAEGIEPAHFRPQRQNVVEDQQDADQKHAEDEAVEAGIG